MVIWMLFAICFAATLVENAHAQDKDEPPSTAQRWLQDYYLKQAEKYEFFYDEARTKRLTFVEKPIFRWKQDDDWSGDLFVWTHLGRPEVVGCILASSPDAGTRSVAHEFHTLAPHGLPRAKTLPVEFTTRPVRLTLKEREVWTWPGGGGWITGESTKPYETFFAGNVTVPADNP